ncbi:MAG: type II toxin-antitoxin system ParD family antitoxin [Chelatococcus sp.]|nr:MAG: type II toxin-antitoxin system ParD family antitoxin [Chelatococcus sp.]
MATMTISLPEAMKRWVEGRSEDGRYGNSSDYVRDLIRRDQEREATIARIQQGLDEARSSGVSSRGMDELWREAQRRAAVREPDAL